VRLDPKWNNGDYYGKEPPLQGMAAALKIVSLHANQAEWAEKTFGFAPATDGKAPGQAMENKFKIEATLDAAGAARAKVADPNNFLYLVKANQLAKADPSKIKAPTLMVYTPTDLVFPEPWIQRTAAAIKAAGTPVETFPINGPNGHLNGVLHIAQAGPKIAEFLAK
jgi:homoserine O-acetyltransferase